MKTKVTKTLKCWSWKYHVPLDQMTVWRWWLNSSFGIYGPEIQLGEYPNSNSIEFWDCPSDEKWHIHASVDKETKKFDLIPLYPSKTSWDFNKKEECDNIIKEWRTTFKTLDLKGKNFLNLLNNDLSDIEPSYNSIGHRGQDAVI